MILHDMLLNDIYGYCIIPKNTLLFRGYKDASFHDCMFFSTKYHMASVFSNNKLIQVWKTLNEIQVLFLVEYLDHKSCAISALPQLFNYIFPSESNPDFDDLDIKQRNIDRRTKLIRKLFDEYKISGWLSSIENKIELEICLFDKEANASQIQLIDKAKENSRKYFKDSLSRIKVFPAKEFYDKTYLKLREEKPYITNMEGYYKIYKKTFSCYVKDIMNPKFDRIEAKHFLFNLRTKLKI